MQCGSLVAGPGLHAVTWAELHPPAHPYSPGSRGVLPGLPSAGTGPGSLPRPALPSLGPASPSGAGLARQEGSLPEPTYTLSRQPLRQIKPSLWLRIGRLYNLLSKSGHFQQRKEH